MKPVLIDVFFPIPEGWGMCNTCELMISQAQLGGAAEERGLEEYPAEYQEEFQKLSSFIYVLADQFQEAVKIRLWDPRSFQGLLKSIRHGVHRYPTYILNGRTKYIGFETDTLQHAVQAALESMDSGL